jgi:leader peptidase (prepilin peptidase)/N-methyltransferase
VLLSFVLTGQPGSGDVKPATGIGAVPGGLVTTSLLTAATELVGVAAGWYRLGDGQVPMAPPIVAAALIIGALAQVLN